MTRDEWLALNKLIERQLMYIAERTKNMAWLGTAHPNNPDFVALLKSQQSLAEVSKKVLEWFEADEQK